MLHSCERARPNYRNALTCQAIRVRQSVTSLRMGLAILEVAQMNDEVFPGLWVSGMSVCATLGDPRMGSIFGGMLLSGRLVAGLITSALAQSSEELPV